MIQSTNPKLQRQIEAAEALVDAARWDAAVAAYEELLAAHPEQADAWYNLGLLLKHLRRFEPALAAYQRALDAGVTEPEQVRVNRAVIFADNLLDPAAAERELLQALEANPKHVPALLNLANLREDRGNREAARALYQEILRIAPQEWEAMAREANIATIRDANDPVLRRVTNALLQPAVPMSARASLAFALGRGLDAAGAYDAAFTAYQRANEYSRANAPPTVARYSRAEHTALTDRVIAAFARPTLRFPVRTSAMTSPPVFICGMFRSGSTLAEKVLAAHPRVTAGGELDWLPNLIATSFAPFPETSALASDSQLDAAAREYQSLRAQIFPHADVLTDKRPDNFMFVGLIKQLFPDAKIIHTVREPLDNCLSVFFLHLDHRKSYATDLGDIAHYYTECHRLMAHWQRLYPADILQFDYDRFVVDQRHQTQRLLEHCGLDWQDRCLDFHAVEGVVKTASVWQVREPLHARSSGRWRHYERHLGDIQKQLAAAPAHTR